MRLSQKDPQRAIGLAQQAEQLLPNEYQAYVVQGNIFYKQGDLYSARENFAKAQKRLPEDSKWDASAYRAPQKLGHSLSW